MTAVARLLCPVDLSETSARALTYARTLARRYHAMLTILEVVSVARVPMAFAAATGGTIPPATTEEERAAFLGELQQFVATVEPPAERLVVREGPIVQQILAEAREGRADLIVLGTHGRGGFDRFLLGSVTEKVVRKAPCPVMTVPPGPDFPTAVDPLLQTILCAIDFSPSSFHALEYALSLADDAQATLVLVHVVEWPSERRLPPWAGPAFAAEWRRLSDAASRELELAVPAETRRRRRVEDVVLLGRPHEEIARLAHDRSADLLVLGVHGRSEPDLIFFGSTVTQALRHLGCPVLTVRPVDHPDA